MVRAKVCIDGRAERKKIFKKKRIQIDTQKLRMHGEEFRKILKESIKINRGNNMEEINDTITKQLLEEVY